MGEGIKKRHHMKAMIITALFLIVSISFIMWLKEQAAQRPVPTEAAVVDAKSTDWKKYGIDVEGEHFFRFDASGKAFPDVLSVKTKIIYNEEGKKKYIEKRQKNNLPVQGFEELNSRTVLYGLNCISKKKEFCVLEVFELTKEGKTLDYAKAGSYKDWNEIPPGTVYEELHRVICPERNDK
ncbi:MAG: hypothetical protein C0399_01440 [Syntrophus sp. (in: bacteria)]|nr:hypothetical protein [Syntrophus sp. (in: bacteria)]